MKKIILAIALFVALGLSANAQSDGFFSSSYTYDENRNAPDADGWELFNMPSIIGHGYIVDQNADPDPAPVGSGLLILAGLGVAYAMRKKN